MGAFNSLQINARLINRRIFDLAIPAIASNLLGTTLFIIDTIMISRYAPGDPRYLAAAAVAWVIIFRSHRLLGSISTGTMALVARHTGDGDAERVGKVVGQSVILALVIGAGLTICGLLGSKASLRLMQTEHSVIEVALPFLQVIFTVSVARLLSDVSAAALQGSGDTRSPMYINLCMNVINVGLNWLLIYGHAGFPRLGLTGSAIASAAAMLFSAAAMLWIMFAGRTNFHITLRHFRLDRHIIATIFRVSGPTFLEELLICAGLLPFTAFIMSYGAAVVAAQAVVARIENLALLIGGGFSVAAGALVGQSIGARNIEIARLAFRRTAFFSIVMMSVVGSVLVCCTAAVVGWFVAPEDPVSGELALVLLPVAILQQPLLGFVLTIAAGLRGAGDTFTPMIISFTGNVLTRFAICWCASKFHFGIVGIYIGLIVDWVIRCAMLWVVYRRGHWARIELD